ncbi:hypothetical protein [Modicisalibacter coralii]|uniref:hypothetical protein n=1 Tax=Modicisalibacter coralii TaxID=2304602 RepID=UPI00100AE01A|nr:hypothetical protein [Halomonas coralii]
MSEENGYFEPQAHQVEPGEMRAFGVPICSRHARANELCEMLRFVQDVATQGAAAHLKQVLFDSDSGVCHIDVDESAPLYGRVEHQVQKAARKHLSRFTLCGDNELGETLASTMVSQPTPDDWEDPVESLEGASQSSTTDDDTAEEPQAACHHPSA